ncbi:MAG TPA: RNA 2'-phosphotransferase [Chitinophagaceae bacterium]|jgi:putative RNA 2'-phosphotransferase|nr:RNA 2'-phosphotransferase [Chitinophagaceae bacterium]
MLSEKETKRLSKFLSLLLRHQPEAIGLVLDEQGWVNTDDLINKIAKQNPGFNLVALQHIVQTNAKQRFRFSDDGSKIRASQGHSIEVELNYEEKQPPALLYHGTAEKNISSILAEGLHKRQRHHVHLSADTETSVKVGQRHGKPIVLIIDAAAMFAAQHVFYQSDNGVWLTESVPSQFIST